MNLCGLAIRGRFTPVADVCVRAVYATKDMPPTTARRVHGSIIRHTYYRHIYYRDGGERLMMRPSALAHEFEKPAACDMRAMRILEMEYCGEWLPNTHAGMLEHVRRLHCIPGTSEIPPDIRPEPFMRQPAIPIQPGMCRIRSRHALLTVGRAHAAACVRSNGCATNVCVCVSARDAHALRARAHANTHTHAVHLIC